MSKYHKVLSKIEPKDMKKSVQGTNYQVILVTFGIFDTQSANWKYYLTSCIYKNNEVYLTDEVCRFSSTSSSISVATNGAIHMYGRELKTAEEGIKWAEEFKMKWESGSNDILSEVRDKKLDEILK
jgi:hypothetical protein